MSTLAQDLSARCRATAEVAEAAVAWFNENQDVVHQELQSLTREFRKFRETARRLEVAVERPMCVGVFGPSQSGKSYLISALARRGTEPLIARFEGVPEGLDFVRHINPEGGQESTGLVTRFSIRPVRAPPEFPVHLRLLSQADLIKILGNSYFSDCDLSEEEVPSAAKITEVVNAVRSAAGPQPIDGLSEDDVLDVQEYFERQFKGEQIVKALSSGGFWEAAASIGPRLPPVPRARLFSLIWGEIEPFTLLFQTLLGALNQLGHPVEAFCRLDALVHVAPGKIERRGDSIIDVGTLQGLATAGGEPLAMATMGGRPIQLPRSVVTALVAEIRISMSEPPWDFFNATDLLDFPGARSRENFPEIRRVLTQEGKLEGLFLRGKVAYLFERYWTEQELTSMLLCIGPSNQEVRTLPSTIKDWIDTTHGADPEARAKTDTALFLVLTKFDAEFIEAAGQAESSKARWTTRLNASLLDFFGKAHDWPHEWVPGRAFDNTFFLRNPNIKAKHILDYDDDGRELGIRPSEQARIARYREEYLQNDTVRRHIHDPGTAWDEAFRPQDGGVSYLARSLAPVCNPDIKRRQIAVRLLTQRHAMRERLQRYFVSGDIGEQRSKRRLAAEEITRHLARCAASQRFGRLLRSLQLSDGDLVEVFYKLETQGDGARVRTFGTRIDPKELLSTLGIGYAAQDDDGHLDSADVYAAAALEYWIGAIRSVADSPRLCRFFQVPEGPMSDLADELIAGATRLDLRRSIAGHMRPAMTARQSLPEIIAKPALLAADVISGFVMHLGFASVAPAERPKSRANGGGPIFAPRPPTDRPQLSEVPSRFDQTFYADWFTAFLAFVDDNAMSREGQKFNVEQNARLGELVGKLGAAA